MVDIIITDACYYEDLTILKKDPYVDKRRRRAIILFINEFAVHKDGTLTDEDIATFISEYNIAIFPDTRVFLSWKEMRMFDVQKYVRNYKKSDNRNESEFTIH